MSQDDSAAYKHTLNLPRTDFPMRADLVEREPGRLQRWEEQDLYRRIQERRAAGGGDVFILHDGPPFANGDVHMGTALNKVLKDLVIKSKTMAGWRCPYVPGWDCHGLPIEFKVVKEARGLEPAEIRRRSEAFARRFIDVQRDSFRRLGVFGDWQAPYLTLSPQYEADIIRVFAAFAEQDLVYQSKKPVLWSYGARTALAEAEVEYEDRTDPAIYVSFPFSSGPLAGTSSLVIWTTTPWTLPANLGIALHPRLAYLQGPFARAEDGRREDLVVAKELLESFSAKTGFVPAGPLAERKGEEFAGASARHPFLDRESRVVTADFVTTETGTGAVHMAPGHGADDYRAGQENGLGLLSPVDDDGRFTAEAGLDFLVGMHVHEANGPVIKLLAERGALLAKENYRHSYPHCWRSKTPVIFRSVPQFFLRIDRLRQTALEEIDRVEWLPRWGKARIRGTVESRPDWCISRQRVWGVPLPVFYRQGNPDDPLIDAGLARQVADLTESGGTNLWFEKDDAWWAERLGLPAGTTRCHDTLDVWIDSGSSHAAVLDRHPELRCPADLYLEATDQHRGWFQSSLMVRVATRGAAPYKAVLTHGFVVDQDKKKLSKSAADKSGKPTDAAHFYGKYGADILRLWVSSVDWQNEVPFGEDLFKQTAEPYRRFRNILRILLGNLHDFDPARDAAPDEAFTLVDRWILERLAAVTRECRAAYADYEFRKVFNTLNQFCAVDLSALYVDVTKDRLYCDAAGSLRRRATQTAMHRIFDGLARLLAPVLAFTADEAWEHAGHAGSVHLETFPEPDPAYADEEATGQVAEWERVRAAAQAAIDEAIKAGRFRKRERAALAITLPAGDPAVPLLRRRREETLEFLMVSSYQLSEGDDPEIRVAVEETSDPECPRCRRSLPLDGDPASPGLCRRCASVTAALA